MSNKQNTVFAPKLRFLEFLGTGNWTVEKLGAVATICTQKVGNNVCVPMSITTGVGLVSQEDKFGRVIAGDSYKNYLLLKPNEFAYNKSATKEYPEGFLTLYTGTELAAVPNSIFTCFRINGESPDVRFLNYQFSDNLHGRWIRNFIQVGARAHGSLSINDSDLMALPVSVPSGKTSVAEQQKIADCLSSLDKLIVEQARKVEVLKTHKKGLMQQLFPREGETQPRLRFPEFEASAYWESRRLEDLAKRGSGHTPSKSKPEYYEGDIKWVSLADSKRLDAGLIYETATSISAQGIKNSSAVLHPAGTVLISRDAGVGKSAVMATPMAVSQHFIVWTCQDQLLSNWFLYYVLQEMKPIFERNATGSTIKTIGLPFFKELEIATPSLPEQKRIADCLASLDTLITAATQELNNLKAHKKGLMQKLFPSVEMIEH